MTYQGQDEFRVIIMVRVKLGLGWGCSSTLTTY